jgi:hypothetical protein
MVRATVGLLGPRPESEIPSARKISIDHPKKPHMVNPRTVPRSSRRKNWERGNPERVAHRCPP